MSMQDEHGVGSKGAKSKALKARKEDEPREKRMFASGSIKKGPGGRMIFINVKTKGGTHISSGHGGKTNSDAVKDWGNSIKSNPRNNIKGGDTPTFAEHKANNARARKDAIAQRKAAKNHKGPSFIDQLEKHKANDVEYHRGGGNLDRKKGESFIDRLERHKGDQMRFS